MTSAAPVTMALPATPCFAPTQTHPSALAASFLPARLALSWFSIWMKSPGLSWGTPTCNFPATPAPPVTASRRVQQDLRPTQKQWLQHSTRTSPLLAVKGLWRWVPS